MSQADPPHAAVLDQVELAVARKAWHREVGHLLQSDLIVERRGESIADLGEEAKRFPGTDPRSYVPAPLDRKSSRAYAYGWSVCESCHVALAKLWVSRLAIPQTEHSSGS